MTASEHNPEGNYCKQYKNFMQRRLGELTVLLNGTNSIDYNRQRMLCKPPLYANYGNSNLDHRIKIQGGAQGEWEEGFAKV